jgi:hypothetical protein
MILVRFEFLHPSYHSSYIIILPLFCSYGKFSKYHSTSYAFSFLGTEPVVHFIEESERRSCSSPTGKPSRIGRLGGEAWGKNGVQYSIAELNLHLLKIEKLNHINIMPISLTSYQIAYHITLPTTLKHLYEPSP